MCRQVFYTVPVAPDRPSAAGAPPRRPHRVSISAAPCCWPCRAGGPQPSGKHDHVVDYRHVIHALRAQAHGVDQSGLSRRALPAPGLPADLGGTASSAVRQRQACRTMVGLLALAHDRGVEAELAQRARRDALTPANCPTCRLLIRGSRPSRARLPDGLGEAAARSPPTTPAGSTARRGRSMTADHHDRHRPPANACSPNCACPPSASSGRASPSTADNEGWPAARILAACRARARRAGPPPHRAPSAEARLPPGKTLDSFDFAAVPMVSKAHVMALAAGDAWLDKGANICCSGRPASASRHLAAPSATP